MALFNAKGTDARRRGGRDRREEDPIACYVTFLTARDLYDDLRRTRRDFFRERRGRTQPLDDQLARLPEIRASLPLDGAEDGEEFLSWFEASFLSSHQGAR